MPKYRVVRGTYRNAAGERAERGDIIEISEERRATLPSGSYEKVDDDDVSDDDTVIEYVDPEEVTQTPEELEDDPRAPAQTAAVERSVDRSAESDDTGEVAEDAAETEAETSDPDYVPDPEDETRDTGETSDADYVPRGESDETVEPADAMESEAETSDPDYVPESPADAEDVDDKVSEESVDPSEVEASGDVPDDYDTLSKMAKHYDGEEVHGSMSGDELSEFFNDLSDTEVAYLKDRAREEMESQEE